MPAGARFRSQGRATPAAPQSRRSIAVSEHRGSSATITLGPRGRGDWRVQAGAGYVRRCRAARSVLLHEQRASLRQLRLAASEEREVVIASACWRCRWFDHLPGQYRHGDSKRVQWGGAEARCGDVFVDVAGDTAVDRPAGDRSEPAGIRAGLSADFQPGYWRDASSNEIANSTITDIVWKTTRRASLHVSASPSFWAPCSCRWIRSRTASS